MKKAYQEEHYLIPDWPAHGKVMACVSYRSRAKELTASTMMAKDWGWQTEPQNLIEVHGTQVIKAQRDSTSQEGDAVWTDSPGLPCAVWTADCLPVIFCDLNGTKVAAAHAGWKGLLKGVLKATVEAMGVPPEQLMAWFGPAISQPRFEVGPEVRDLFVEVDEGAKAAFSPNRSGDRFYGNLYALARMRLAKVGVTQIFGGELCTFNDPDHWFSSRRDGGIIGCQATVIWLK